MDAPETPWWIECLHCRRDTITEHALCTWGKLQDQVRTQRNASLENPSLQDEGRKDLVVHSVAGVIPS